MINNKLIFDSTLTPKIAGPVVKHFIRNGELNVIKGLPTAYGGYLTLKTWNILIEAYCRVNNLIDGIKVNLDDHLKVCLEGMIPCALMNLSMLNEKGHNTSEVMKILIPGFKDYTMGHLYLVGQLNCYDILAHEIDTMNTNRIYEELAYLTLHSVRK